MIERRGGEEKERERRKQEKREMIQRSNIWRSRGLTIREGRMLQIVLAKEKLIDMIQGINLWSQSAQVYILFLVVYFSFVFIELVTVWFLFYVLVFRPRGTWDLRSPTRDQTFTTCVGKQSLNHQTTGKFPLLLSRYVYLLILLKLDFDFFNCVMKIIIILTF